MATNFPQSPPSGTPPSETRVWLALQKLPDLWRVFHGVNWHGEENGRSRDGEADFVLVHPVAGLIVIEVKGGDIEVDGGEWYSVDHKGVRHPIKDPVEQAMISKKTLVEYIKDGLGRDGFIPAAHAIAFPEAHQAVTMGPNAPIDLIMSRTELRQPESFLVALARRGGEHPPIGIETADSVTRLLAPKVSLHRKERDIVADVKARIEAWTDEQVAFLDDLADNNRQLVLGGAGTGKTVLAKEKARRLAAEGQQVLLTCFNNPLADYMAAELDGVPGITVDNFHGLVRDLAARAAVVVPDQRSADYNFPAVPDQDFWDSASADLLVAAAGALGVRFDAIVVDEGQDFPPEWFLALEFLLADPFTSHFYVFADRNQALYRDNWEPPFASNTFRLRRNVRNTNPIAEWVSSLAGEEMTAMGVIGPDPEFFEARTDDEVDDLVRRTLHRLIIEGGLEPKQVAILCQRKEDAQRLRRKKLAGQRVVSLESNSDGVVAETIHRYKGLEADACVVILRAMSRPRDRALAYVGISRAKARLIVIGPQEVRRQLNW
jgi:hypothetical protein